MVKGYVTYYKLNKYIDLSTAIYSVPILVGVRDAKGICWIKLLCDTHTGLLKTHTKTKIKSAQTYKRFFDKFTHTKIMSVL